MKRVCFFAVILVLLFNIFNPVTMSSAVPNPATTITIWHEWWDPNLTNIQGILDQYHDLHPEVTFSLYRPNNMHQELAAAIPNGTGPDVIAVTSNAFTDIEMSNYIIDLDQLGVTATFLNSTYEPAAVAGVMYTGKIWAIPDLQEGIALVYNKALVNSSYLPADPLNFTGLYDKALAFKTATHKPLICNQGFPGGDAYHTAPVFFGFGVPSYVDDAGNVYANTPAAISAGTWLSTMPALSPTAQSFDDCASQFYAGDVGMWWTGPWAIADIVSHGIDFGIVPMGKPFVGIRSLMISSNAQKRGNAAVALEVMKYLTNYGNSKALSLLNMTIPANTQAFQDPAVQALPTIAGFGAAISIGVLMSPSPYSSCQWGPMGDAETRIWSASYTPTEALNIAQDEIRNCVLRIIGHFELGQPGTSFRYMKTMGTTEEPYLVDTEHINHPEGLFIDGSDNLFVVETNGARLLKFLPDGTLDWSIGKAGVSYTDNYVFSNLMDVALDTAGNVWVADNTRIAKYDPDGVFVEQLPANDPWNGGSDNEHFGWAHGVAVDQLNHLFVSDTWNHRVQVYDISSGSPVYSATIGENGVAGDDDRTSTSPTASPWMATMTCTYSITAITGCSTALSAAHGPARRWPTC